MLQLYNTMTRCTEPFEAGRNRIVRMFTCGPSIYRRPHIGNYRTFVWEDALQRYLEYLGCDVRRVINFTDVEDKALDEAAVLGKSLEELTGESARWFFAETELLGIKLPDNIPRSSTSVEQAAKLIDILLRKGFAYWDKNDVFFDPLKFEGFGKLFRLDMNRWPRTKKRFRKDTYPGQRWNLGDFVLWHGYKPGDTVFWDAKEIGKGRPSWNIQDPAMISESLGYELDIFCGGIDNLYRHHDYNIAVMEAVSGKELARFWLHCQHLLVGGKKMSKSLNNIVYTENITADGYTGEHIRFFLLHEQYRKRLNYTHEAFRSVARKFDAFKGMLRDITGGETQRKAQSATTMDGGAAGPRPAAENSAVGREAVASLIDGIIPRFQSAMDEDLDLGRAMDMVCETVSGLHSLDRRGALEDHARTKIRENLSRIDTVLRIMS